MKAPIYERLASIYGAIKRCQESNNLEWLSKHQEKFCKIMNDAPSGSGIDAGTTIDLDKSTTQKLIFYTSYHHMDEHGHYDGWTEHTIIVTPSLETGIKLRITGRNRNDIKDYLYDVFRTWLTEEIDN